MARTFSLLAVEMNLVPMDLDKSYMLGDTPPAFDLLLLERRTGPTCRRRMGWKYLRGSATDKLVVMAGSTAGHCLSSKTIERAG